ncbi:MAG: pectinesterase family protein, partial [Chloroflexota bacterium]
MISVNSFIRKTSYYVIAIGLLLGFLWLLSQGGLVSAQAVERVQQQLLGSTTGNSFSYQGYLDNGANPANGSYDFEFALFDAVSNGNQIGSTQAETLVVSDGVFMVELNNTNQFGTDVFDGSDLYLEIRVYDTDSNSFVTLTPRQGLTAVPYAHFAKKVEPLDNVINVAKSGGDFTTITDALNAITDASATNPYLIRVAPGIYQEQINLKSYVDIQGSGETNTTIRYAHFSATTILTGADAVVRATGNIVAEMRHLTIENSGGSGTATGIWAKDVSV